MHAPERHLVGDAVTWLQILAAACLAWGIGAATVVAALDKDGTLHHLLALLHHIGDHRG